MSRLEKLATPKPSQLHILRDWLEDPKGGHNFLKGSEVRQWSDEDGCSFVRVPATKLEDDPFTQLISRILIQLSRHLGFLRKRGGKVIDIESGLTSYNETKLDRVGKIIATILSSVLPVVSIFALYVVKNTYGRIGMTVAFTGCFAAILSVFSSARRVEIFGATATSDASPLLHFSRMC